jgi:hypothetical protein
MNRRSNRTATSALWAALLAFAFSAACASKGEIKPDLVDDYLQNNFDWAMYIDVREVPNYLNYKGSHLRPVTRARVYLKTFPRGEQPAQTKLPANLYEDLWYHKGKSLGLRRHGALKLGKGSVGAIILGLSDDRADTSLSAANALLHGLVDLQVKQVPASCVIVPDDKYDGIVNALAHYNFRPRMNVEEGEQMSVHLRSAGGGKDDYYFLQK